MPSQVCSSSGRYDSIRTAFAVHSPGADRYVLRNLEALNLNSNDYSGTLPAALGNLSRLERLWPWPRICSGVRFPRALPV